MVWSEEEVVAPEHKFGLMFESPSSSFFEKFSFIGLNAVEKTSGIF